jgi:ABC-2 type transport system permease protein
VSRGWWALTLLVARREWRERLAARSYRISTAILVVAVGAAVVIPAVLGGGNRASKVGVVGGDPAALAGTVRQAGAVLHAKVSPIVFADLDAARAKLRSGDLDAVYVAGREVLLEQEPAKGDSNAQSQLAGAIAQLAAAPSRATTAPAPALAVHGLKPPPTPLSTRIAGLAVVVLIYLLVFIYGQRITSGVVEEKSSRVVEVLLGSVRPSQLLTGKVLGMGVTAFLQVAAVLATFLVAAAATGSELLHGAAVGVVLVGAMWLVLGYALYCTAFAAAGALITRESDASNVTFPVALPLLLSYVLSFGVIFGGSPPTFFKVLAYIPPTAPIASTTLYAIGDASIGDVLVSAALCLLATGLTARVAARIYERSILRTGARVRVREALRGDTVGA